MSAAPQRAHRRARRARDGRPHSRRRARRSLTMAMRHARRARRHDAALGQCATMKKVQRRHARGRQAVRLRVLYAYNVRHQQPHPQRASALFRKTTFIGHACTHDAWHVHLPGTVSWRYRTAAAGDGRDSRPRRARNAADESSARDSHAQQTLCVRCTRRLRLLWHRGRSPRRSCPLRAKSAPRGGVSTDARPRATHWRAPLMRAHTQRLDAHARTTATDRKSHAPTRRDGNGGVHASRTTSATTRSHDTDVRKAQRAAMRSARALMARCLVPTRSKHGAISARVTATKRPPSDAICAEPWHRCPRPPSRATQRQHNPDGRQLLAPPTDPRDCQLHGVHALLPDQGERPRPQRVAARSSCPS